MASAPKTPEERLKIITDNLQEVLNPEILEAVLKEGRDPVIYWGTAPTGKVHCGYLVPMLQIASFLRAGCKVKILLADIHAFLDAAKAPLELVKHRSSYYKHTVTAMLRAIGVNVEGLEFVVGSSYQLTEKYNMDVYRTMSIVDDRTARRAGADVVKQSDNIALSSIVYPLLQALDEEYLGVDAQFGGVDQRKIFALAKEVLPKLGYKERAHLMNPMVPGLTGGKMSASDPDSKIDILDTADAVKRKIKKAFAQPKIVEENGLLGFVEHVLLPVSIIKHDEPRFTVERREGEPLVYTSIEQMQNDYREDILTPQLLKLSITDALNQLLAPIQEEFQASEEWQKITNDAYPPPPAPVKKVKVKKDKGSRYPPGGKVGENVVAQADGSVSGPDSAQVSLGKDVDDAMKNLDLEKKEAA